MIGWLAASLIAAAWASIGIWAVAYKERREREHRGHMDRIFEAVVAERDDLRASLHAVRQDLGDAVTLLRKERKDCANLRERLEIAQREERAWRRRAERAGLWTAVADALPDDPDEPVAILMDGDQVCDGFWGYHTGWTDRYGDRLDWVTHWARLPGSGAALPSCLPGGPGGSGGFQGSLDLREVDTDGLGQPAKVDVVGPSVAGDPLLRGVPREAVLPTELGHGLPAVADEVSEGGRALGHGPEDGGSEAKNLQVELGKAE